MNKFSNKQLKDAKKYMSRVLESHRDPKTGEINYTSLTEDTACELNLYLDRHTYMIPEELFEIATSLE